MDPLLIYQEITIWSKDNMNIAGYIYQPEEGPTQTPVVFLIHSCASDHKSWEPFALQLTEMGYLVLSIDLRGYGASGGHENDVAKTPYDVSASLDYLLGYGYDQFICIGASVGGTGCLAATKSYNVIALGMISSTMVTDRRILKISRSDLENLDFPKVVAVAEDDIRVQFDQDFIDKILSMYEMMAEPKVLKLYPGIQHGVELLDGDYGEDLIESLLEMIETASE